MSDQTDDSVIGAEDKVQDWTIAMFKELGLGKPSSEGASDGDDPPDDPPPEGPGSDDSLEERRAALKRELAEISLPDRMPTDEKLRVEQQITGVEKALDAAVNATQLDRVATAVRQLKAIVDGLHVTMAKRLKRAENLGAILSQISLPDMTFLGEGEVPDLAAAKLKVSRDLSGPIDDTTLEATEATIRILVGELKAATALSKGRLERADAVRTGFAGVARPDGGVPDDYTDFDNAVPAIKALETSPVTDKKLGEAETALTHLKSELTRLQTLFEEREKRAETVRDAVPGPRPEGINADEADALSKLETQATDALGDPLSDGMVETAEAAIKFRDELLEDTKRDITKRTETRSAIQHKLTDISLAAIRSADGLDALETETNAITEALPGAQTDEALEALSKRVIALGESADNARATRAAGILAALKEYAVPDGLPASETSPLTEEIEAIRAGATAPFDPSKLEQAGKNLADFPAKLEAAAKTIVERKRRVDEVGKAAAAVDDPGKTNKAEKLELKTLREAKALAPAEPFDDIAVEAAEAAFRALKTRAEELEQEIKTREDKRAKFVKRLLLLVPPAAATGAEALKVLKEVGALRKTVDEATTSDDVDAQEAGIENLEKTVKDLEEIAEARANALVKLATAEQEVKQALNKLIEGAYNKVAKMLADATSKIDKAKTVNDFTDAEKDLAKIAPYVLEVEGYLTDTPKWRFETELYVGSMPATSPTEVKQKEALEIWRTTLLSNADALAVQGKLAEAAAELDKFYSGKTSFKDPADDKEKEIAVDAARDEEAKKFAKKVANFSAAHGATLIESSAYKFIPSGGLKGEFSMLKRTGYVDGKWADAKAALALFKSKMDKVKAFLDKFIQYEAALTGAADPSEEKTTYDAVVVACGIQDFDTALGLLTTFEGHDSGNSKKTAEYKQKRASLKARVQGVLTEITGAANADLQTPWTEAETEADHDEKMKKLTEAEAALPALENLLHAKQDATILKRRHDDADTFKLLADAESELGSGEVAKATAAYLAVLPDFQGLERYLGKKSRAQTIKDSLPANEAERVKALGDALTGSEAKALAKSWVEACKLLDAELDKPVNKIKEAAIGQYQKRFKRIEARHKKVLDVMIHPDAKVKLTTPWAAIEKAVNDDKDYLSASELLDTHEALLADAKVYVDAAIRTRKALLSMHQVADELITIAKAKAKKQAESDFAGEPEATITAAVSSAEDAAKKLITDAIYPDPSTKAQLTTDLAAAEEDAEKGEYASATTKFDAINTSAADGMKEAAKALEKLDGGHYFEAHGPDVNPDDTKKRILTGRRPDGKTEPSSKSSQFLDVGDFMASRQMALEHPKALAAGVGGTSIRRTNQTQVFFTFDVGKEIGISFVGGLKKKGMEKGELGDTQTYENYQEERGLTEVQVKFIFQFDDPDPSQSRNIKGFDDYDAKYPAALSSLDPATHDYPGRWKINQLFPTPKK